jgi:YD repeat-containing protein
MQTVSDGTTLATYGYLANSDWLATTTLTQSGAERLKAMRTLDAANRLVGLTTTRLGSPRESHTLRYNAAGQRDRDTLADGSYWEYTYNTRGEVLGGVKRFPTSEAQAGYEHGYAFDPIGNRKSSATNGRTAAYGSNVLNQYSSRQVPPFLDVLLGTAQADHTEISVFGPEGAATVTQQGTAFHATVPVDNAGSPRFPSLGITGFKAGLHHGPDYEQTAGGKAFLPKNPEVFTYDEDGNLTSDGRWNPADLRGNHHRRRGRGGPPHPARARLRWQEPPDPDPGEDRVDREQLCDHQDPALYLWRGLESPAGGGRHRHGKAPLPLGPRPQREPGRSRRHWRPAGDEHCGS